MRVECSTGKLESGGRCCDVWATIPSAKMTGLMGSCSMRDDGGSFAAQETSEGSLDNRRFV